MDLLHINLDCRNIELINWDKNDLEKNEDIMQNWYLIVYKGIYNNECHKCSGSQTFILRVALFNDSRQTNTCNKT